MSRDVYITSHAVMHNFLADTKTNDMSEDQVLGSLETNNRSEDLLPGIR